MIHQLNMQGKDKVQVAIDRFRTFEPPEGYYLAFSGGKDSVVIKALADMAGVKYDAHYNLTSVDPPELVQFVKSFPDVIIDRPKDKDGNQITMWNLIPRKKFPPTMLIRYCCQELKETQGQGRFVVTGVRWAESIKRKKNRGGLEIENGTKKRTFVDPDNPDNEQMARFCPTRGSHVPNPVIDWSNEEVWEFIHEYNVPYCKLYDQGRTRLGCIGCPMSSKQKEELELYPKYKAAYIRTFDKMLKEVQGIRNTDWQTGEDVYNWWVSHKFNGGY